LPSGVTQAATKATKTAASSTFSMVISCVEGDQPFAGAACLV
jgi:hypothetical protein